MEAIDQKIWWNYIGSDLQKLFITSKFLIDILERKSDLSVDANDFDDYAFVIFPSAKAYEGFLKKLFRDLGFITEEDYFGKHFRIGKSLNPSLPKEIRNGSVYGKIVNHLGEKKLADFLWDTWTITRNLTFHWFPNEKNMVTLPEAKERVDMIISAIDMAFENCGKDLDLSK